MDVAYLLSAVFEIESENESSSTYNLYSQAGRNSSFEISPSHGEQCGITF